MANNDLVNSLMRGMEIVKLVSRSSNGMRLNEIAAAMELKTPTAFNLLRTLEAGGFLDKRGSIYFVGRELAALTRSCEAGIFGAIAEKALFSLYRSYPDIILIFGVAEDGGVAQTLRMSFDRPGVIQHLDHELLHPYTTAAGLVGLAFANPAGLMLQEERRPFAEFGAEYWKNRENLDAFLEQVRRDRFAVSPFDRRHFTRLSAGVFDAAGKLIAVIGSSAPGALPDPELEKLRNSLLDAADTISSQFSRR
ncbi:MAG: helix-turn-helix domain-containing protein [Lentisphaeria bacterium]|nr:helix-turn-helix domain-containing protein [Lentisphaeria bacterium]